MSTNADDFPFTRASDLPANSRTHRVKETTVEYADGTAAMTIYAGDSDDESRFGTTAWVSALGESFVALEEMR